MQEEYVSKLQELREAKAKAFELEHLLEEEVSELSLLSAQHQALIQHSNELEARLLQKDLELREAQDELAFLAEIRITKEKAEKEVERLRDRIRALESYPMEVLRLAEDNKSLRIKNRELSTKIESLEIIKKKYYAQTQHLLQMNSLRDALLLANDRLRYP
ncbi:unnamed protein product [Protopolystoma xenopodis]|uniref:Uncharacterized protein n=1 Tax=Protopolystoma xenopodis TaxID=117903 RepID=A0A3S5CP96_9PLAT|nr:unnamed protein product [Protopolystoma xenopodis]